MRDARRPPRLRRFIAWLESSSRELMLLIGIAILGGGLWPIYKPAAFVVPGAILVAVAVFGVAPGPKSPDQGE